VSQSYRKFDLASQKAIRGMARRVAFLTVFWLLPWMAGQMPLGQVVACLSLVFSLGGIFAMLSALLRHEKSGGPTLNSWDEAIAFSGLAALMHAVSHLLLA
jgi:hypothetical protein